MTCLDDFHVALGVAFASLSPGDVLPWLFEMLRSPGSAVERSGAAHGLSEAPKGLGSQWKSHVGHRWTMLDSGGMWGDVGGCRAIPCHPCVGVCRQSSGFDGERSRPH